MVAGSSTICSHRLEVEEAGWVSVARPVLLETVLAAAAPKTPFFYYHTSGWNGKSLNGVKMYDWFKLAARRSISFASSRATIRAPAGIPRFGAGRHPESWYSMNIALAMR